MSGQAPNGPNGSNSQGNNHFGGSNPQFGGGFGQGNPSSGGPGYGANRAGQGSFGGSGFGGSPTSGSAGPAGSAGSSFGSGSGTPGGFRPPQGGPHGGGWGGGSGPTRSGFTPQLPPNNRDNNGKKTALIVAFTALAVLVLVFVGFIAVGSGDSTDQAKKTKIPESPSAVSSINVSPDDIQTASGGINRDSKANQKKQPNQLSGKPPSSADNDSAIYHTSEGLDWLENPGIITPGARIVNVTQGANCSTGYIVGQGDRYFILTAGHCGAVGDVFAVPMENGSLVKFGEVVESTLGPNVTSIDPDATADYGLIEIYDTSLVNSSIAADAELERWEGTDWIESGEHKVCRLGYRTGLACGNYIQMVGQGYVQFRNISDHGDSGGPVFTVEDDGSLVAIGVDSNVIDEDATRVSAMSIGEAMTRWDLDLYG